VNLDQLGPLLAESGDGARSTRPIISRLVPLQMKRRGVKLRVGCRRPPRLGGAGGSRAAEGDRARPQLVDLLRGGLGHVAECAGRPCRSSSALCQLSAAVSVSRGRRLSRRSPPASDRRSSRRRRSSSASFCPSIGPPRSACSPSGERLRQWLSRSRLASYEVGCHLDSQERTSGTSRGGTFRACPEFAAVGRPTTGARAPAVTRASCQGPCRARIAQLRNTTASTRFVAKNAPGTSHRAIPRIRSPRSCRPLRYAM
jgi:hypothetical protein